ncbi:MAG: hypothetical protein IJT43_02545 [Stomatobaculum sp.]|nr:hypothetical protein [Stomatobaculum sp.]
MCKKGLLVFRDYCSRILRHEADGPEWLRIPRHQCSNPGCAKVHRMLPDFMVPFKHYQEVTISDAIDGRISADETDDLPSEHLIRLWKRWIMENVLDIEGHLRSIGHRELGFSEELLGSGDSILQKLRSSIPDGWLKTILRVIYNSGGALSPFYC